MKFVTFTRLAQKSWDKLISKDPDTLYFVWDEDKKTGSLYVGNTLISKGSDDLLNTLNSLDDVELAEDIRDNVVLTYDKTEGKWVGKTIAQLVQGVLGPMSGATIDKDGQSGLVPVPLQGSNDRFLRVDGTWAQITDIVRQEINKMNLGGTVGEAKIYWKEIEE